MNILPDDVIVETGELEALSDTIDWGLIDTHVPIMWEKNRGEGITIMVIDTAISRHHDYNDNILWGEAYDATNVGSVENSQHLHSTMVAGVIVAKDSGYGIIGVAPKAKVIPVRVFDDGGFAKDEYLIRALEYAIKVKPDVINLSLGRRGEHGGYIKDLIKELFRMDIPMICAMGNYGINYSCFPANYPECFGITSYNKIRNISEFSSRSTEADFSLPGEDILTTSLNNQYSIVRGTSFASPFMCGIVAIILAQAKKNKRKYTIPELKKFLESNCIDLGPNGRDDMFGSGIPDLISISQKI